MTDAKLPPTYEALVAENRHFLREYDRVAREKHKLINHLAPLGAILNVLAQWVDDPEKLEQIEQISSRIRSDLENMKDEPGFLAEMEALEKQREPA